MAEECAAFTSDWTDEDRIEEYCDHLLEHTIERVRTEYRKAWLDYIGWTADY